MDRLLQFVYVCCTCGLLHFRRDLDGFLYGAQPAESSITESKAVRRWWIVRRNGLPIDGVMAITPEAALRFGETRNVFRGCDSISVTMGDPCLAYELACTRDDEIAEVRAFFLSLGFQPWPTPFMVRTDI